MKKVNRKKTVFRIIGLVAIVLIIGIVFISKTKQVYPISWAMHHPVNQVSGKAISGYDPVAYFTKGQAVKGSEAYSLEWNETRWYFASEEHLALFRATPEKYAPQFGGYCAFALSTGFSASSKPDVWHIENDKLYLFAAKGPKGDWLSMLDDGIISRCEGKWNNE